MLLRDAVLPDLPALLDVQQEGSVRSLGHIFPQDTHPFPRADIEARWVEEMADPGVRVYVIEHGGRLAGFAALRGNELFHFGTAVDTWGTGLASAAHDELVARLAGTGATSAWLRVFEENHRARRFYERHGWRPAGRSSRSVFPPYPVLVEYGLRLDRERT